MYFNVFEYGPTFSTPPVYSVANTQMNFEEYHSTELQSFYPPSVGVQQNSLDLTFYHSQSAVAIRRCEWCLVKLSELNDRDGYCDRDLCVMCMVKYNQNQIYLQSNGIACHANSQKAVMPQQPFMPQELVRSQQPIMPLQPIIPQRSMIQPMEQMITQQSMMPQEDMSRQRSTLMSLRSTISSLLPAIPQLQTAIPLTQPATPLLQPTTPQQV